MILFKVENLKFIAFALFILAVVISQATRSMSPPRLIVVSVIMIYKILLI